MTIEPFSRDDIPTFLDLAATEGWVAEAWEFDFLLAAFPEGCFCARDDAGEGIAFVTSLRHGRSGWIGNLIVRADYRGRGIGEALFMRTLNALGEAGVETFWLTASKLGKSLYEKHGFSSIDTIIRWTGFGRKRHGGHDPHEESDEAVTSVSAIDYQAWGDRRDALLAATVGRGRLLLRDSAFLVIQPCGDARQFGPFSALDGATAEHLLDDALLAVPSTARVYLDSPASNRGALRHLNRRRMRISGSNELMYAGSKPDYRPEFIYGLATMGSCG
ncbi:MAG TPA: GNAT family N-acetyltransferase [Desulfuromonadaceae bacterium]